MIAFTNALRQEDATVAFFLSLALLVLRSECMAKSAKKILLVEDNNDVREFARAVYEAFGLQGLRSGHRS